MLEIIRKGLYQVLEDIDAGNSSMSEEEMEKVVEFLGMINDRTHLLNRTEAAEYMHMSQRTFDRYVHDGMIPKGMHHRGDKQLTWRKSELDNVRL